MIYKLKPSHHIYIYIYKISRMLLGEMPLPSPTCWTRKEAMGINGPPLDTITITMCCNLV